MEIYMTSIHNEVLVSFLSSQTAHPLVNIGERPKIDVGGCSEMVGWSLVSFRICSMNRFSSVSSIDSILSDVSDDWHLACQERRESSRSERVPRLALPVGECLWHLNFVLTYLRRRRKKKYLRDYRRRSALSNGLEAIVFSRVDKVSIGTLSNRFPGDSLRHHYNLTYCSTERKTSVESISLSVETKSTTRRRRNERPSDFGNTHLARIRKRLLLFRLNNVKWNSVYYWKWLTKRKTYSHPFYPRMIEGVAH